MKKIIFISTLVVIVIFADCTKPCQDLPGLEQSVIVVNPFNVNMDNYFYPNNELLSPYKKDSLKVINEDGRIFPLVSFIINSDPRNPLKGFYAIKIVPAFIIPDDNNAFNAEKTRKIFIKYDYSTADTLSLVFKAKKTKCDKSEYEYLKIYHRNIIIASVNNDTGIDFTLKH